MDKSCANCSKIKCDKTEEDRQDLGTVGCENNWMAKDPEPLWSKIIGTLIAIIMGAAFGVCWLVWVVAGKIAAWGYRNNV